MSLVMVSEKIKQSGIKMLKIRGVVIFNSEHVVSGKVREYNSTMGKANDGCEFDLGGTQQSFN